MHKSTTIFFSLLFLFSVNTKSQSILFSKPNVAYLKSYTKGIGHLISSPVKWNTTQMITAGLCAQTTLMLLQQDAHIKNWIQQNRNSTLDKIGNVAKPFGNGLVMSGTCAATYISGALFKNEKLKNFGLQSLKSIAISSAVVGGAKMLSGRPRPYQNNDPLALAGPLQNLDNRSFFSGHATFSFSMASSINIASKKKFWGIAAYTLASCVALSRMENNHDWSSDVFFGACMGTAMTYCLWNNN